MKSNYIAARSSKAGKNTKKTFERHKINAIHVHNVHVNYNNEILNNISLTLKPGFTYGFVGSTEKRKLLINLLRGAIKPIAGGIFINNTTDIKNVEHWSSYITLVEKENQFFSEETVYESKLQKKITIDDLAKTALFAAISDTLLKTSPILIFDEAISSLGIELEERVLQQICLKNKNNVIIFNTTHPSSLKYCDHIFLLKNNRISEISKQIYFSNFPEQSGGPFENYYSSENVF